MAQKARSAGVVDPYAAIALHDCAENQDKMLEAKQLEARKKGIRANSLHTCPIILHTTADFSLVGSLPAVAYLKQALDEQIAYQQEAIIREREEDKEWCRREQDRIAIWNDEERKKIAETKAKNQLTHQQRERQLLEHAALRKRANREQQEYDLTQLAQIREDIRTEVLLLPKLAHSSPLIAYECQIGSFLTRLLPDTFCAAREGGNEACI